MAALVQAWPSLVMGPLEHLWEAGLDPLDPLFLANIIDPAHHQVCYAPPLKGKGSARREQTYQRASSSACSGSHIQSHSRRQPLKTQICLMQGSEAGQCEIGLLLGPYPCTEVEPFLNF